MSTSKEKLKYRFRAHYADSIYVQPEDDKSIYHTGSEDWWPSAFRDIDQDNILGFSLFSDSDEYYIDMKKGVITKNGEVIYIPEQPTADKKLIYYRVVQKDFDQATGWGEPRIVKYVIGWETKGSDIKEKIEINCD